MIISMLKAPKTSAPPPAAHIIVASWDPAQYFPPYQKILRKALDEATHQYQIIEQPVYNKQESMLQVISEQLQADNVHSYQ